MSAIAVLFDAQGFSQKNYDDCMDELNKSGGMPLNAGLISHTGFQKGNNWFVMDVWRSEEEFMAFGKQRLFPIFEKLQITPPHPQIFKVHNYVGAEELVH